MTRTELLSSIVETEIIENESVMFMSWFLDTQSLGLQTLLCPDILYSTFGSSGVDDLQTLAKHDFKPLDRKHNIQGITLPSPQTVNHIFSCSEVGLECSPRSQQEDAMLLPWCCIAAFAHILKTFEAIATELEFHYELDSGSALGAVKLGQFLPWDIDGDIYASTDAVTQHFLKTNGKGSLALARAGIELSRRSADCYYDAGAGYFVMTFDGIEVEVLGRRGDLTLRSHPEFRGIPTRIKVGDVWARVHANPGAYARSRYGPGHLRHAQSWRFQDGQDDAFAAYSGAGWRVCADPRHHACLDRHPLDGNVIFHPDYFTCWKGG